ncbi:MAG: hypothetical protein M0P94_02240 [Candidatus Absconditabacterales bacterium]|nr:hypothetical protein [Candidatus Absconditabacterales bacterium]
MKKLSTIFFSLLIMVVLSTMSSCKKEQKLQPNNNILGKNFIVLVDLEKVHKSNQGHIKIARTTTDSYNWDDEVVVLKGPAGYSPLYHKAAREFGQAYQKEIMPDTTQLCVDCMQEKIIKKFLDLKWENTAEKAFKKMRLAIPKDLYEVYPRFFEIFLSAEMEYLTKQIGGNPNWYGGTRSLDQEKEIMKLFYKDDTDFQDPWECNCSPHVYVMDYYKKYVPGNNKKSLIVNDGILQEIPLLQEEFARQRYNILVSANGGYGLVKDYKTQYDQNEGVYYLEIPAYGVHNKNGLF